MRALALLVVVIAACHKTPSSNADMAIVDCPPEGTSAPNDLRCTGLERARPFAPASSFWSDGASKQRYIYLPDAPIDTSDPDEWLFPVGTKAWKELSIGSRRVETRFFWKVAQGQWVRTTYVWSADGTSALRNDDGIARLDGTDYEIPSRKVCDECHGGRKDRLLGFEAIGLGLPGASGVTLDVLAAEGRLTTPIPAISVPEDATGKARDALIWLHVNCGTSCHSANPTAKAFPTGLLLRLRTPQLGGSVAALDSYVTTVGVPTIGLLDHGEPRIAPGDPSESVISERAGSRDDDQMPPVVTHVVDQQGLQKLNDWITALGGAPSDGGVESADGGL